MHLPKWPNQSGLNGALCERDGQPLWWLARRGFTLIEMMAVLLVILTVSGIAIGSFTNFSKGNRLIVGVQLISDFIRQARHTARTSGAPVVLRISERTDANGRIIGGEISGISQTTLADEPFEKETWQNPAEKDANGNKLPIMGRAGHGLQINASGSTLSWPENLTDLELPFVNNDRSKRIIRSRRSHDGFMLSASVFVPPIQSTFPQPSASTPTSSYANPAGTERFHWALMLIGEAASPDVSTSLSGLMLRKHIRPQDRMNPADGSASKPQVMVTWELLGWINDGTTMTWISSVEDHSDLPLPIVKTNVEANRNHLASWSATDFRTICSPNPDPLTRDGTTPLAWTDPVNDVPVIIDGGHWIEVGLMYDGRDLSLFLNGGLINRKDVSTLVLPTPSPEDQFDHLWIGAAVLPATSSYPEASGTIIYSGTSTTPPTTPSESHMRFDDVRLLRLGVGQAVPLPTGVRPWTGQSGVTTEIVVFPDGRCVLRGISSTGTALSPKGIILAETTNPAFSADPQADPVGDEQSGAKNDEQRKDRIKAKAVILMLDGNGTVTSRPYDPKTDKP